MVYVRPFATGGARIAITHATLGADLLARDFTMRGITKKEVIHLPFVLACWKTSLVSGFLGLCIFATFFQIWLLVWRQIALLKFIGLDTRDASLGFESRFALS